MEPDSREMCSCSNEGELRLMGLLYLQRNNGAGPRCKSIAVNVKLLRKLGKKNRREVKECLRRTEAGSGIVHRKAQIYRGFCDGC